jgi:carbon monoxide dehydrogenase subunit G
MQLEQRFELPASPAQAWPSFKDIALLVDCLPGASLTGPAEGDQWPMRFDVRLGPIAAAFAGQGRVSFDDEARHGRFEGQAVDRRTQSRVKGTATFRLEPAGTGTQVLVDVDYTLTGSLAQLGRGGIVRELASALTAQFAGNLAGRIAPAATAAPNPTALVQSAPAAGQAPATAMAAPPDTRPLSAIGLLWLALKRWLRRRLGQPTT